MNMRNSTSIPGRNLEARYEKYKSVIRNYTLMNDIFMRNVFKQRECLEYVLQIIMERQDLHVMEHAIQKDYKNLQGRSAIMDCVARDPKGKQFNVELHEMTHLDMICPFIISTEKSKKSAKIFQMKHISYMSIPEKRMKQNLEN